MSEPTRMGRPRTRPPVRRVTVEIDAELLARVEVQLERLNGTLREAVEAGLRQILWQAERDRTITYE